MKTLFEKEFLLSEQSHSLYRAFYIPYTDRQLKYGWYRLLELMAEDSNTTGMGSNVEKDLLEKMAQGVSSASNLPMFGAGFELYNINPKFVAINKKFRSRILFLLKTIAESRGYPWNSNLQPEGIDELTPAIAHLLDQAISNMDFYENNEQAYKVQIIGSDGNAQNPNEAAPDEKGGRYAALLGSPALKAAAQEDTRVTNKPQLKFMDSINNSDTPFTPKLRIKHNASKQRTHHGQILTSDSQGREWLSDLDTTQQHPYEFEILNFKIPERQLTSISTFTLKSLDETPLIYVETEEQLKNMIEKLNSVEAFAADLEHNEFRSFLGLTCLIQISTADEDYIIDPFPIWNSLYLLNEPFTNPNILKVLHGADSDVLWLQRDFGIYVVNMVDTGVFMRLLDEPKRSLQALVLKYCGIELNKSYQRSDWRMRPLDRHHLVYARSDSHYLLYCYQKLCQELKSNSKKTLLDVYNESKEICLRMFEQPRFNPKGYMSLLEKSHTLNNQQLFAMERLWTWRDKTARIEDESYEFVLPKHMLYQIAEKLPRETSGLLSCCSPIPMLVKRDLFILLKIVKEAKDLPIEEKPSVFDSELGESIMLEAIHKRQQKTNKYSREFSRLDCRFDQSEYKVDDERPKMESRYRQLFNDDIKMASSSNRTAASMLPFQSLLPRQQTTKKRQLAEEIKDKLKNWATPYDSYMVEMLNSQEEEPELKRVKVVHSTKDTKKSS
ncbi:3'-5' exonuclease [Aphelenchoides bicaudatus]|nr:3'-5' exonuclease [Aphelenchoides bicaudatus]